MGRDRKAQIFEREGSWRTVKEMRNSLSLGISDPSNNDFALRKIDFKTRECFEAEKREFQMSNTGLVKLNHNDGIVRILKMSDAIGDKVRADRSDVAGKSSPRQNMGEGIRDKIEEKGGNRVTLS